MAHSDAVLVAVDGSASALGAARWAAIEAGLRGRPLIIGTATAGRASSEQAIAQAAIAQAADAARAVLPAGHDLATQIWDGSPIHVLLDLSASVGLIVLGHRGLGDSPVVGSVTESVAAHGHCPVVVVREWAGSETSFGEGPVVVGIDGSADSEAAIALAMSEASVRGAKVRAVHAWSDLPLDGDESGIGWESVHQRHDAALAESLAGWQERYPDVLVERVVVNDRPVRHLLAAAEPAQLLVVGHRGRGVGQGILCGSTSRALLHTAPCPLLIVKPAGLRAE